MFREEHMIPVSVRCLVLKGWASRLCQREEICSGCTEVSLNITFDVEQSCLERRPLCGQIVETMKSGEKEEKGVGRKYGEKRVI